MRRIKRVHFTFGGQFIFGAFRIVIAGLTRNYTQKEMDCEFASLNFSVSNVSNSTLYFSMFLTNLLIASLKSSLVR